jgi:CBS domain containing-hemolysin-like protein
MVHEFTPARDVMNMLIKQKLNLAWVVDERGGTAGIVALEDIFEEIFGEIADEHDQDDWHKKISDTEYVFPGRQEISTLNEEYDFNIPEDEAYHTLSGLIVTRLEEIPEEGQFILIEEYKLIVEEVSNTKIEQVRIIVDKS